MQKRSVAKLAPVAILASAALTMPSPASATSGKQSARQASPSVRVSKPASSSVGRGNSFSPQVLKTNKGPTGYTVTFRYRDPTATSVQIKGEWYFSSPSATTTTSSQGLLPSQWRPGDFPIAYPNSLAPNWPVTGMKLNAKTGVWSVTIPLPSGIFTYGFFVNCSSSTQTGCTEISDPSNPPWNIQHGQTIGSVEPDSEVYVPSDKAFNTVDYSWQAPSRTHGRLIDRYYASPASLSPPGHHQVVIYTPPGYSARRTTPYPTLYISHGGGGNEVDWSTQGALGNILDNLIRTGQVQPMVVVMPNANGYPAGTAQSDYAADLSQNLIPYVQAHYNVSTLASQRAFAGLSLGGGLANYLLLNDPTEFSYFGVFSPGGAPDITAATPAQIAGIKAVAGILIGGGHQDPIHGTAAAEAAFFAAQGVADFPDFINGGHEWYVWRILLRDFLTRVAFEPPVGQ